MRELGKNIKSLREAQGLTQDSFAERLHVTRQTVSNYENGRSQPDLEMLARIAAVLQVELSVLLGNDPAAAKPAESQRHPARPHAKGRLMTGGGAVLVLLMLCGIWQQRATVAGLHFDPQPALFLKIVLAPLLWLTLGWTLMQLLEVLIGLRPLGKGWYRHTRWVIPAFFALYLIAFYGSFYFPWSIWMACVYLAKYSVVWLLGGVLFWLLGPVMQAASPTA